MRWVYAKSVMEGRMATVSHDMVGRRVVRVLSGEAWVAGYAEHERSWEEEWYSIYNK